MTTKKAAPKKAAKPAKPAKKAAAKPMAKKPAKAAAKPAAKKQAKPAAKAKTAPKKAAKPAKPVAKKAATAKKQAPPKKAVPAKKPAPAAKKPAVKAPVKAVPKAVAKPAPIKAAPAKAAPAKAAPVKHVPASKPVMHHTPPPPFKKPVKKEPAKPVVIPKTSTDKKVKYEPEFTKSVLDKHQYAQSGPTMRYSDAELTEFRELINRKLESAKKELAYLQGLITRKDESGDLDEGRYMTMEDGSMSMEREQLSQMASRQIQFIDHLEKAMMRIENKTYGICRVTGKLIDKARLRAVPHATLSIEAKQMMNK